MSWHIDFYQGVPEEILAFPAGLQARMLKLFELIEVHGANLGAPHTEALSLGLFEVRAKAAKGIARALFCYLKGRRIIVLVAFVKKTQKTPTSIIKLAGDRMKEVTGL